MLMEKKLRRKAFITSGLLLVGLILLFPAVMGTKTYPLAIVEGNSMYPNLQNGDIVIFHSVQGSTVANGSVVVFVQGQTGVSFLDPLIRPVIIHRVVGVIPQYNGLINFKTKGDNNQDYDPALIQEKNLLGEPVQVIPKVGLLLLFIKSSQGMVAVVGFITLLYLGNYESKIKGDIRRRDFIGAVAKMALNGEISHEQFTKFEVAVNYSEDIDLLKVNDGYLRNLIVWINAGGLACDWKISKVVCPTCQSVAVRIEDEEGKSLTICEKCEELANEARREVSEDNRRLIEPDAESSYGEESHLWDEVGVVPLSYARNKATS
jgi:signal peptidase I